MTDRNRLWLILGAIMLLGLLAIPSKQPAPTSDAVEKKSTPAASPTAPASKVAPPVQLPPPGVAPEETGPPAAPVIAVPPRQKPRDADDPPPPPEPELPPATYTAARQAIDDLTLTIRNYRTALGGNPVGDNAEITAALLGNNLKQIRHTIPETSRVNAAGELCDLWGTPYFFHQLSGTKLEIRSAGPDRKMWTGDDVNM